MNIYSYNGGSLQRHMRGDDNLTFLWEIFSRQGHDKNYIMNYNSHDVKPCVGCRCCTGDKECYLDENMFSYGIKSCDGIVVFSPIYFFSFSARAKAFIDRLYSYDLSGKMITAVTVSGSSTDDRYCGFDLIKEILKRTAEYCGAVYVEPINFVTGDKKIDYPVHEDIARFLNRLEVSYEAEKGRKKEANIEA